MIEINEIAKFTNSLKFENIPKRVINKIKISLLYNISVALAGKRTAEPAIRVVFNLENKNYKKQNWISTDELSLDHVAFCNACMITAISQNETLYDEMIHTGCVIIPSALAIGEKQEISGSQFLTALVAGYETTAAVSEGVADSSTKKGFRPTSLYSPFGASVACCKILKFNEEQIGNSIAIVSNFVGGTMQCWIDGTCEWLFQVGNASKNAIIATMLASEKKFKGSMNSLTGLYGFYNAYTEKMTFTSGNFGKKWRTEDVRYKLFPGCAHNQVGIYIAIMMKKKYRIDSEKIEEIIVSMNKNEYEYPGVNKKKLEGRSSAIMSIAFAISICFLNGVIENEDYDNYNDLKVKRLMDKMIIQSSDEMSIKSCKLVVKMRNGLIYEKLIDKDENISLYSWNDAKVFAEKLMSKASYSKEKINRIITIIETIDELKNIKRLVENLK